MLSRYFNEGMEMTMARFYENPTARAQAALLAGSAGEKKKETKTAYPGKVPAARPIHKKENTVFLTGATGFFGAHLLKELLDQGKTQIICLVRNGDKKRLEDVLSWYFGAGWTAGIRSRIRVAAGDLSLPCLGMEEREWKALADEVDGIYHSAADVRHYAADAGEFMNTNVTGTETMIALSLQADAVLHYISTASISGDFLKDEPEKQMVFTEDDFYIGQNWEDNIYIRSKFLAEACIYKAMEEKG